MGITMVKNGLPDQNIANRWDTEGGFAQISCFYTQSPSIDENYFISFAHTIDSVLVEAAIEAENEAGRLWIDTTSQKGSLVLKSEKASVDVSAMGITGDFFQFHPVKLLYGSYFSSNNLMDDGIIIDEDIAWQLFGSNDVVGMQVSINEVPHYIIGVIERADDRFSKEAGLSSPLCYVSLNSLSKYGIISGGFTYEALLPNPVEGYALSIVKENQSVAENQIEIVENSNRYSLLSLGTVVLEFGTRSMNQKGIIYPYFENVARGWEDVLALLLVVQIISLLIVGVLVVSWLVGLWKRRTFTSVDLKNWIADKKEDVTIRIHKRNGKKITRKVYRKEKSDKSKKGNKRVFNMKNKNKNSRINKEE